MESKLLELEEKIDKLIKSQEEIIFRLNEGVILPKKPNSLDKKLTVKEEKEKYIDSLKLVIENGAYLKLRFNLAAIPRDSRILEFLRTKDSSVFDGLKRN